MRPLCGRPARSAERGIVLVVTLLFAVTVLGLAVALTYTTTSSLDQRRRLTAKSRAVQAAESGMHHVVAALNGTTSASVRAAGGVSGTLAGDEDSARAVRYEVRLEEAGSDGYDNDFDGCADEPDERTIYEAVSVGYCDDTFVAIGATIRLDYPATISSATYLADPLSEVNLNGSAFRISGYDVDANRVATGLAVPGIGVAGDPQQVRDQIRSQIVSNVEGSDGSPSVRQVPRLDLGELIESGTRGANVVLPSGSTVNPGSPGAWGTLDAPAIVYGTGDIHVSGGATGAGLLVVDGNLRISGGFEWFGLIVVRGDVAFVGGGSGQRLTGALVVEQRPGEADGAIEVPLGGTVDILFSTETIALAMRPLATYTIMNWREAAVPPSIPKAWLVAGLIPALSLSVEVLPLTVEIELPLEIPPLEIPTVEIPPVEVPLPIEVPILPKPPKLPLFK